MERETTHSFLDVVDNALGTEASSKDLMSLNQAEIEDLTGLLSEFYLAWLPPASASGDVRVYVETDGARYVDWHPPNPVPRPPLQHLLYVDVLVLEDHVASSVGLLAGTLDGSSHWSLVRRVIASALDSFRPCQPLLEGGNLVLVPEPHLEMAYGQHAPGIYQILNERHAQYERGWNAQAMVARHAIRDIATRRFPGQFDRTEDGSFDFTWEEFGLSAARWGRAPSSDDWTIALRRKETEGLIWALSSSINFSAQYLPGSLYAEATHRALLTTVAEVAPLGTTRGTDAPLVKINPALVSGDLPMFFGVPVETLVDIRRSESAFVSWRSTLRNAVRLIQFSPSEKGFDETAQEALRDLLEPAMNEVRRSQGVRNHLRSGLRPASMSFALGAIGAAASGAELSTGVSAAGLTSLAALALAALFPQGQEGPQAVLLRLLPHVTGPLIRKKAASYPAHSVRPEDVQVRCIKSARTDGPDVDLDIDIQIG